MAKNTPRWWRDGHVAARVDVIRPSPSYKYPIGFHELQEKYGREVKMHSGGTHGYSLDFHNYRDARDFTRRSARRFPDIDLYLDPPSRLDDLSKIVMYAPGKTKRPVAANDSISGVDMITGAIIATSVLVSGYLIYKIFSPTPTVP